jgi:hypothetical protein
LLLIVINNNEAAQRFEHKAFLELGAKMKDLITGKEYDNLDELTMQPYQILIFTLIE